MKIAKVKAYKKHATRTVAEGAMSIDTRAVQRAVEEAIPDKPERRKDGTISLNYDWIKEHAPMDHAPLQTYLLHQKLDKILNTYLNVYVQSPQFFPRVHILGPRSGRMAYSAPNLQNVSKRKWGIRSVIVPRPGNYFVRADYTAQELYTLAQSMIDLGVEKGPLFACLSSGSDPHRLGAALTIGKPMDQITPLERQAQKAVAFGVPGGLGPKKLADYSYKTFNLKWTIDEARQRRRAYLRAFDDVDTFLKILQLPQDDILRRLTGAGTDVWQEDLDCGWNVIRHLSEHPDPTLRELGERASRQIVGHLRTGRVRAGARFTEIANTYFQGLAADVTKVAMWKLFEAGRTPTLVVHDEMVVEFPERHDHEFAKAYVEGAMLSAFKEVCPDTGAHARVELEVTYQWGRSTDGEGNDL